MKKNNYIIATFLCIIIYVIYLVIMQIYPFGENSILKSDLYQQYANFFCYLKEIILNGKSIFMSWNLGLANNFYTTFAYYLISPLNLLVVFFNASNIDIFVEIVTLIKIILMANFFILFLDKSYRYKSIEVVLFGLIYAYSSYVICYSFHIMWLDCVYMLPIVLIFVDKYLEKGKILGYILSLSYAILTNYYIGFIVAFFSGIYYLAKIFLTHKENFWKKLFKFLFGIVISFGIGMIVILPSVLQLKGKMSANVELIKIDLDKIRLFINVIFNNYVYMFTQKSCFMFSSTLTLVLLPMYYFNKNIFWKEKLIFSLIIIFLLLPIISPFLNKLWHCFTEPNCFNYRYSFTLILIMILMAAREFQNKKGSSKKHFLWSFLIFTIFTVLEIIFINMEYLESDGYTVSTNSIYLSCVIYLIILLLTYIIFFTNKKNIALGLLFIMVIADLLIGAKSGQNNNDKYFKREAVIQYNSFMKYFTTKLKNPEIERIVFMPDCYGSNMSLKYGYSNIGFFSSARNRETLKAMYRLGYNVQMDEQLWLTSYSGTFFNYDIAGVKYYITKEPIEDNEIYGFEFEEKYDNLYVYRNKNYFNIGYYLYENIKESYNPFKMQNEYLQGLMGEKSEITKEEELEKISGEESETAIEEKSKMEKYFQNIENSDVLKCSKIIINESEKNIIKYTVKALKDCNIYLASDYDLQVYINEEPLFENYSNIWSYETGIKQIVYLKQNEELEFTIVTKQNLDLLFVYVSNNEEIKKVLNNKNKNYFDLNKIEKNGLIGTANFQDDGYLVFEIAYDNRWDIWVDGEKKHTEAIAGCFLGVKIDRGVHEIEIRY